MVEFGVLLVDAKTTSESSKGTKHIVKLVDEAGHKIALKVSASEYDGFNVGDSLTWSDLLKTGPQQQKLDAEPEKKDDE